MGAVNWPRLWKATAITNVLTVATGIAKTELTLWSGRTMDELWSRVVAYGAGLFVLAIMAPLSTWMAYKIQHDGLGLKQRWQSWRGSSA